METYILLITAILGLITYYILRYNRRPKNFPPGPTRIPIFGNALQLGRENYKVALSLREKYGNIIGFQLGSKWTVFLHDADDIRDAFSRPDIQGKHMYNPMLDEAYGKSNHGVMFSDGRPWLEQRRFCLRTLRDFGFGKKTMESIIMEETTQLIQVFRESVNTPFSTSHAFNSSILNVIWSIVAGERYEHHDPRLEELIKLLLEFMTTLFKGIKPFYFIFPSLVELREKLPLLFPKPNNQFRDKLFAFLRKTIQNHRETLEEGNPRDFIDTYLEEQKKIKDAGSSFHSEDNDDFGLTVLLADLFIAGAETTSSTLCWSFFLLALHPEAQEKLAQEIKSVVGNREVCLSDKPSLPYVEATTMEIMRVSTLAPNGSVHSASDNIIFKGFNIPKDTIVLANLYAVHYRQDIWGDPEIFRPERFLSVDEKSVVRNSNLIPFLVGRRSCLGEALAKDEVFLFLTNVCQQFRIEMPQGEPPHTMRLFPGGVSTPEPHQIVLRERNL